MKKTLAALIVSAVAAASANATTIYENDGSKIELNGSLRILLEKANQGGVHTDTKTSVIQKKHSHTGLKNDDSRLEVKATHKLANDFYALARVEFRFDGKDEAGEAHTDDDGFGAVRAHRAYIGLGKKELGELTFGRQVTIADDGSTAEDMTYGIINKDRYLPTSGKSVVRYDYKGIEGLQLGVTYLFPQDRDDLNEVKADKLENGIQFGALYEGQIDENNGVIAKLIYGRTNYKATPGAQNHNSDESHKDGVLASLGYNYKGFIFSVDGGYFKSKNDTGFTKYLKGFTNRGAASVTLAGSDTKGFYVSPGFQVPVIVDANGMEVSKLYGNYLYQEQKSDDLVDALGNGHEMKTKDHGFLLGVTYKLHKQVVTYLEGKYVQTKYYVDGSQVGDKTKDKAIGAGVRVYF